MAVSVKKLEGTDVPEALQAQGLETVFEVRDSEGQVHIRKTDEEAAALAVEFSERDQKER